MSDELVTVSVNAEVCIGSGQCEMLEEETFYVNEDTVIAEVTGDGRLPRDRAERCVDTCPAQAISIVVEEAAPETEVSSRVEEPPGDRSRPAGEEANND